mmetsp:Transcript_7828/g.19258  ORF Transcript_7828/g.19258 Transcript_7828/m.19258 type:complete len:240 (-) Transcript_7828:304-1023(-)
MDGPVGFAQHAVHRVAARREQILVQQRTGQQPRNAGGLRDMSGVLVARLVEERPQRVAVTLVHHYLEGLLGLCVGGLRVVRYVQVPVVALGWSDDEPLSVVEELVDELLLLVGIAVRTDLLLGPQQILTAIQNEYRRQTVFLGRVKYVWQHLEQCGAATCLDDELVAVDEQGAFREDVGVHGLVGRHIQDGAPRQRQQVIPHGTRPTSETECVVLSDFKLQLQRLLRALKPLHIIHTTQ